MMIRKILLAAALAVMPASIVLAAYCGRFNPTGGGGGGTIADSRVPCSFFVAATGGNDANAGTSAAPFATLAKLRATVASAPSLSKVACLKAGSGGTYNSPGLSLTSADNGETWETDPASAVNSAILNGGGNTVPINASGTSNLTINGIAVTNCGQNCINVQDGSSNTITNNDVSFTHSNDGGAAGDGVIGINNSPSCLISHNYVHDANDVGISVGAFFAGNSYDKCRVTGNVVLRGALAISDTGLIYLIARGPGPAAGSVKIDSNYVRDLGSATQSGNSIYLDDHTSNAVVTGNIVGCGATSTSANGFLAHNGSNNKVSGNIFDACGGNAVGGPSGNLAEIVWFSDDGSSMAGNTFTGNIVLGNFGGAPPQMYFANGVATSGQVTISNNAYTNYGSGGNLNATGGPNFVSDSSPQQYTPAQIAISGYLYTIGSTSAASAPPVSFPPIVGGWGPPGFVVPTSTNHSPP